jgi:competence protein ComEA
VLKRLRAYVIDFFAIGHNEAKGVILLILLTLLFLVSPWLYRWLRPDVISNTTVADQKKLDSLVALMRVDGERDEQQRFGNNRSGAYNSRGGGSRGQDQHLSEQYHEAKPFPFDPNTVSVAGWQQLGLPHWLAERIDKYRSKGGQFRKKEDLLRIYDFPPEAYEQLEPYIQLATAQKPTGGVYTKQSYDNASPASSTPANDASPTRERFIKPPIQPFDINTADTTQLIALKGIGSKMASRIISQRDGLGGFLSAEQYKDIYGMDSINLAELTLYGQIKSPVRKTPINTASAADLDRFPFLSRRQAEVIVNYRNQHGAFTSTESLKAVKVLDAKTIDKLTPYLSF